MSALIARFTESQLAIFALTVIACLVVGRHGPSENIDSPLYLRVADGILRGDFSIFVTKEGAGWSVIGFPLVIAFAKVVAPIHWIWIVWTVNIASSGLTAVLLVAMVRDASRSAVAAVVALLFYVSSFDILIWTRFVLGDAFYGVLACLTFYLLIQGIHRPEMRRRRLWLALATLACFVTRPTGLAVVAVVIIAELLVRPVFSNERMRRIAYVVLAVGVVGASVFRAYVFQDMDRWPTSYMRPKLEEYASREKTGEVVYDRAETHRRPPVTMADHLVMEADRFVRFFQFTSPTFSRMHQLTSIVYYGALYALGCIGAIAAFRAVDRRRRLLVTMALLWCFGAALLSAATVLDYDWRYRMPIMPQLILLAAYGVGVLVRMLGRGVSLAPADRAAPEGNTP
ncbi:MAG TPA: hypothetical protein VHW00_09735 [Thermoanaerobaculia bacterium]|nr:hypothetical protein [Thermoanaerobaculia bacterium]